MIPYIQEVARRIDARWNAVNNCGHAFPDIVLEEIDADRIVESFDFKQIGALLDQNQLRPIQIVSEFSDLHLKLFDNGKFYVEILNWWDDDTAIHDHGFSGVLIQLCGSALNSLYQFTPGPTPTGQTLTFGEVKLKDAFVSEKGDVHRIPPGRDEIHAVLHLEKPTCSLIIRTHPITEFSPQLNYFPPFLCANHSATDLIFNKRIKFLKLLDAISKDEFDSQLLELLRTASLAETFWYLLKLNKQIFRSDRASLLRRIYNESPSERKPYVEKIIASVIGRRASQYKIDNLKPHETDKAKRLQLAIEASCYSNDDRQLMSQIFNSTASVGYELAL
jgi:hypothetical protein